jgi:hypothetical protein
VSGTTPLARPQRQLKTLLSLHQPASRAWPDLSLFSFIFNVFCRCPPTVPVPFLALILLLLLLL